VSDGGRPALFVDRDGTLIREREYLSDPAGVELLPGTVAGLRAFRDAGYAPVIITNQSGIARGFYDTEAYRAVEAEVEARLEAAGVPVAASYHCPHHPDHSGPCACRKPGTGLFRRAARELGLDPGRSVYVGDRVRDVLPALELGGTGLLVRTGYGAGEAGDAPPEIRVVADVAAAARAVGAPPPGR
jgi:D-glycero-D-manno-heptose 1,7-bisphosphate phosphatase